MTLRTTVSAALLAAGLIGANAAVATELASAVPLMAGAGLTVVRAALACPDGTVAMLDVAGNTVTMPMLDLPSDPAVLADCLIDVVLQGSAPADGEAVDGTLFMAGKELPFEPGLPQPNVAVYLGHSGELHINLRLSGLLAAGGQSLLQIADGSAIPTEVALVLNAG
jgi:hypothetical protein